MLVKTPVDPLTATFGANGSSPSPRDGEIDVSLGALRGIPAMAQLWDGVSFDAQIRPVDRGISGNPGLEAPAARDRRASHGASAERKQDPAEIVCTHGALHGLSVALATLPPGTPVLYPQPAFGYPFAIDRAGVRRLPLDWPIGATVRLPAAGED